MIYVTSRELRDQIYRNFADFLRKKAKENPEFKAVRDCLKSVPQSTKE